MLERERGRGREEVYREGKGGSRGKGNLINNSKYKSELIKLDVKISSQLPRLRGKRGVLEKEGEGRW